MREREGGREGEKERERERERKEGREGEKEGGREGPERGRDGVVTLCVKIVVHTHEENLCKIDCLKAVDGL